MSQRLKIAFVMTLVLLNVGLVFLVRQKMADTRADAVRASPSVPPATSTTPTTEATSEPGGEQSLTVTADDAIFHVYGGSCDGTDAAGITVSTDTGATFENVALPEDMRAVFMLEAKNAENLDLVAAGSNCEPQRFVSTDGGSAWETADGADVWFLDEQERVTAPVGIVDPGCTETLTLSAVDADSARVFCASGALIISNDSGETWSSIGKLDGVKAAAYVTKRHGFAMARDGGCETGTFSTDDAGRTWTATGCLDAAPARALAANRNILAVIARSTLYVSEDSGRNWTEAG